MNSKKSICAVVVTYNRKTLLLRCLQALEQQSCLLNHIVIVNNASTDGTIDFLQQHTYLDKQNVTLINLDHNQGGAGGFYHGIKFAHEQGYDYIWLMDDDGYPSIFCLEKLLGYVSDNCYIGPVVVDSETKEKLSFSLRLPNSLKVFDSYNSLMSFQQNNNRIDKLILPFNGTLISGKLIDKVGLPYKDYFIWGDEKEYTLRMEKMGAEIFTVVNAIFYHPASSSSSVEMFFGKLRFNNANSRLKLYCFCRNSIGIYLKHKNVFYALCFLLKTTWFFLFTKPSISNLIFSWKAIWHGFTGNFVYHKKLL
ncbi:glycosyltransferase family 2 protein [Aggregatibacter actinomycetemcomitans]|nr:glycosyltransferase family 2 protein [Aggregatibacter actinomycetemcomitans]